MTEDLFLRKYEKKLVDCSLQNINTTHVWFPAESINLPEALLLSTVQDQLLAFHYVMQPTGVEAPRYIQVGVQLSLLHSRIARDGPCISETPASADLGNLQEPSGRASWRQ